MVHPVSDTGTDSIRIPVADLSCAADAVRLENHLQRQAGVLTVVVNPVNEWAYVTYDRAQTSPETLRQQIKDEGF